MGEEAGGSTDPQRCTIEVYCVTVTWNKNWSSEWLHMMIRHIMLPEEWHLRCSGPDHFNKQMHHISIESLHFNTTQYPQYHAVWLHLIGKIVQITITNTSGLHRSWKKNIHSPIHSYLHLYIHKCHDSVFFKQAP